MSTDKNAEKIANEIWKSCLEAPSIFTKVIVNALSAAEEKGRSLMCRCKERDEIGGDCEVCAEIVKESGKAFKQGRLKGIEESVKIAKSRNVFGTCRCPQSIAESISILKGEKQ